MKPPAKPKRIFISPTRDAVNKTIFRHPVFKDVEDYLPWATSEHWPMVDDLNQTCVNFQHAYTQKPLVFVTQTADLLVDGLHYEQRIFQTGKIATRENNWHDLFNAMMWLRYPEIKSALNARQWRDSQNHGSRTRTLGQCAMTLFDEAGAIVSMPDVMLDCWKQHDWQALFIQHAEKWRSGQAKVAVFGHALLDHALVTETLLVAKCIVVDEKYFSSSSKSLADQIESENKLLANKELRTLPLCGIPGWHSAADSSEFIKTAACFSPLSSKKLAMLQAQHDI
jgi:Protein of unknown function (DUF3025)